MATELKGVGTGVNDTAIGTLAWSNPSNITASDNSRATADGDFVDTSPSNYLKGTNFGFAIPSGATIDGIVVEIEKRSGATPVADNSVVIVKSNGTLGSTNKAIAGNWSSTESYVSYGSSSDLWGETWTDTDINSANFGVALSANVGPFNQAQVDHIRITIHYTGGVATNTSNFLQLF